MKQVLVEFEKLAWHNSAAGARFKIFKSGKQQLRLLEFSEGFEEAEWCVKGHAFYLLEGELTLRMKDGTIRLKQGDTGFLGAGEEYAHKVVMNQGGRALLLVFETLS
jgi:quercetin dioxygenase-like cupin family protein